MTDRRSELDQRLRAVRDRIKAACASAGRDCESVTLIAITKMFPATDIRLLADLGVTEIGENRDQEAEPKHEACKDLDLRWHMVGQLQRNKARSVARYADVVHSVDRAPLVKALGAAVAAAGRTVTALVQVSLDTGVDAGRGGTPPAEVAAVAQAIAVAPGLHLGGVMAVAPRDEDPDTAFARLESIARDLQARHPDATMISAGMSQDLDAAVRHGATHLRVGAALLGDRPPIVG